MDQHRAAVVLARLDAPAPRLSVAIAAGWGAAGNDFYVADNSAETSSVQLVVNIGTVTSPCRFFSVDHTASLPPNAAALKAGASFSTSATGTGAISLGNAAQTENYWFGFNFVLTGAINGVGIVFCSNNSARAVRELHLHASCRDNRRDNDLGRFGQHLPRHG